MIKITCLDGPHGGETREPPIDIDPMELLSSMVEHGWRWEIDYSQATTEEAFLWVRADLTSRIIRALMEGRPVLYAGKTYQIKGDDLAEEVAGAIEDQIVADDQMVTFGFDDERGLEIKSGRERN